MGYRCANCGVDKNDGDDFFRVRIVTDSGETKNVPTCSDECATETQNKNIELHKARVNSVKHQQIQRIEWGKYPNEQ